MKNKVNEIQISYKEKEITSNLSPLNGSKDTAKLLFEHWNKDTIELYETFKILLLNNSNKVKGIYEVSNGGITGTLVDLRVLFAVILKSLSTGVILVHNHPSHNLNPSNEDIRLTNKIIKAAKLFDVTVLDHLIIIPNGNYYSFSDNGLL